MIRLSHLMLAGALAAAGCAPRQPQSADARTRDANTAACRARTEAIYNQQNRYLLSERNTVDSPYSTTGMPGFTSRGLSRQYQRDVEMDNCMNNGTAATQGPNEGIINVGPAAPPASAPPPVSRPTPPSE
jgi:hypothetical protein